MTPPNIESKTCVGLLTVGRGRVGFDPAWGREILVAAERAVQSLPWTFHLPAAPATDDASLRAALDELRQAGCETLVVIQPTIGDGRLAPVLAQLWRDPLVLWATTERAQGDSVSACTLVGTHAFASLLRQVRHPFEVVNGHPDADDTRRSLDRAVSLTLTGARVRRAKIGLIGTHAPGFLNMQMDPALVRRQLGIVAHHVAVQEFIDAVQAVDAAAVAADRRELDALKLPVADDVPDEALDLTSRYTLALRELMDSEHLDALALRCWPELPNVLGVWPYVAMARLFEEGRAIAMEGDFDGALTLLLGKWMDYGPSYLSDWLEHDEHTLTLWHQGEAPLSLCESGSAALGRHFNNDKPGVLNAQLAADRKITLARVWRCDGAYRMTAVDARTAAPRRRLKGTVGLAVFEALDVREWFDDLCHEGMPHHLALFTGHRTDELRRLARLLDVTWIAAAPKNDACPKLVAER